MELFTATGKLKNCKINLYYISTHAASANIYIYIYIQGVS